MTTPSGEPCPIHGPSPPVDLGKQAVRYLTLICCAHFDQQSVVLYHRPTPYKCVYYWSLRWELPYPPPDADKLRESYQIEFTVEPLARAIFEYCEREMRGGATPDSARPWSGGTCTDRTAGLLT